jgi:hypothetical protein
MFSSLTFLLSQIPNDDTISFNKNNFDFNLSVNEITECNDINALIVNQRSTDGP